MVRVPGSSGDSGFHRESQEEVQVKTEQGNEASSDARSTTTSLNARCADRQSAGKYSVDGSEADLDPDPDLEEKPHPPQVSGKGTPADPDSHPDKPTLYLPKDTQVSGSEVGEPRSKTVRKKMKAPDDEEDEDHP
ncbi:hypothetical protein PHMEG_00012923 [Phytophthora megakarya]|uniref:Uncharacterized protein n=1 Tax=Phytophthora megakarya TaxID=4795 RepID=A0A225W7K0_9STRA|nr:hypothetical protein PHMEG_00012923 [Phytophthora megakarya]